MRLHNDTMFIALTHMLAHSIDI